MTRKNADLNQALQESFNPRTGDWISDTKDILLRFLQQLFYQMPAGQGCFHLEFEGKGPAIDEKETELIVTDQGTWNTATVERRPVIIISRGPFAYGNTSLDQLQHLKFSSGQRKHTDLLTGSFIVNCLSPNGLEAERLALIVAKAFRVYRRNLQKAGFFHIGHLVQIGQESPPGALISGDSAVDWINVPVSLPVYYQDWYSVDQNAPLLNTIVFKVQAVFRKLDNSLLVPDAINPDGTINEDSEGVIVGAWTAT